MKNKELEARLPLNLQFFAGADDDKDEEEGKEGTEGSAGGESDDDDDNKGRSEKTFTQTEVSAMMTREKKEGRKALLKQLGFKTEAEAKQAMALYNALMDSQRSEEEKEKENNKRLAGEKSDAEKRAEAAENKLACLTAGVHKEALEDVLAIASGKVTEEKSLDKVLEEMAKNPRYASFFGTEDAEGGTGSSFGHGKKKGDGDKKGSYGASLAKSQKENGNKKKSYFG